VAKKKSRFVFETTDAFGNPVRLHRSTWEGHVLALEHPDMAGYENLVEGAIATPFAAYPSTDVATSLVFATDQGVGPRPEGIRAVVLYKDMKFLYGASTGVVQTAYPVDSVRYPKPKIDFMHPVYKKA
jgi:hypothetical protein